MSRHPRHTADIVSLTAAALALVASLLGTLGQWWMLTLPMSWLLASLAIVVSIIAIIKRQRLRLAIPALIMAILATALPYLLAELYLSDALNAVSSIARWIASPS